MKKVFVAIQPELLLRKTVVEDYQEHAIQATLEDLKDVLQDQPGTWWNAYSQKYGVMIREFPYEARNGFFVDVEKRICTHRFISRGIQRRDKLFSEKTYASLVPEVYRPTWFDPKDAIRTYSVLITEITELEEPVRVENFGLFNSWGKVSSKDVFHHPRLIKPTWEKMDKGKLDTGAK